MWASVTLGSLGRARSGTYCAARTHRPNFGLDFERFGGTLCFPRPREPTVHPHPLPAPLIAALHARDVILEATFRAVERVYVRTGLGMRLLRVIERRLPPLDD
jgi:hypothetical protein